MTIFRRLYLWLRGETYTEWECMLCHKVFDVKQANDHLRTHERR